MRSGGRAMSSAKRWLQYRIVPSAAERQRALAHLFDHEAIRLVGAAQRVDLLAFGRADDERLDVPVADGVDRVLGFLEPPAKVRHGRRRPGRRASA